MQALGRPFAMVPRFFWTVLAFVIYTIAGVAGREHFSEILSNFLSILSYWTAFFIVVVALEHFIFRRKGGPLGGYNLDEYDSFYKYVTLNSISGLKICDVIYSRLPVGIAGILAGCFGVAGAVLGMAQVRTTFENCSYNILIHYKVWYTGPIGKKIGVFGADLGFEVC